MIQKLITQQALCSAAEAVRGVMLEALPEAPQGEFSPGFAQRMEALREAQRKSARIRQLRNRAVAAAVALILAAGMFLGLQPAVRATVVSWFKEVLDTYTNYWFTEEPIDTLPECV